AKTGIGFAALLVSLGGAYGSGSGVDLVPNRAVYDLTLDPDTLGTTITGVRGRIVQEFSGNPCDGYSNSMRWVARLTDGAGEVNVDDIRFASWEDEKGENFQYQSKRYRNQEIVEDVSVRASAGAGNAAGRAKVRRPTDSNVVLPPETIFPTTHLRHIIQAAQAGKSIWQDTVYDASDDGRQVYTTLAVISASSPANAPALSTQISQKLAGIASWRVTVGYYNGAKGGAGGGEEVPVFEQTFTLYANGISAGLRLGYGKVVMRGKLVALDYLAEAPCELSDG
ncbi:MAG: EipB family protein, partial [Paracoccaceae bacterium]